MMTITLVLVFVSAFFTDVIGVHAIFGGFIAGLVIPRDNGFAISLLEKIEDLVSILFLPLVRRVFQALPIVLISSPVLHALWFENQLGPFERRCHMGLYDPYHCSCFPWQVYRMCRSRTIYGLQYSGERGNWNANELQGVRFDV
jgi:hypothetical protein